MSSLYIKEPLNVRLQNQRLLMEKSGQINFHNIAVNEVRERIGKHCTYLSHLTKKKTIEVEVENEDGSKETVEQTVDRIYFLAHLIVKGEKKVVRFDTGKSSSSELVAENYKALKEQIENYVTGKKDI